MHELMTAVIYFGSFLCVGMIAKMLMSQFMRRNDLDLPEIQAQAGRRGKRRVFLLGFWRDDGPD